MLMIVGFGGNKITKQLTITDSEIDISESLSAPAEAAAIADNPLDFLLERGAGRTCLKSSISSNKTLDVMRKLRDDETLNVILFLHSFNSKSFNMMACFSKLSSYIVIFLTVNRH